MRRSGEGVLSLGHGEAREESMERKGFGSFPLNTSKVLNLRPLRPLKISVRKVTSPHEAFPGGESGSKEKGGSE